MTSCPQESKRGTKLSTDLGESEGENSSLDITEEGRRLIASARGLGVHATPCVASLIYLTGVLNSNPRLEALDFSHITSENNDIPPIARDTLAYLQLRAPEHGLGLAEIQGLVAIVCKEVFSHRGSDGLRELHDAVTAEGISRESDMFQSPEELGRLLALIAEPRGVVGDPACGYGGFLVQAARGSSDINMLVGFDLDKNAALIAKQKLSFLNISADLEIRDALSIPDEQLFDTVINQPPWGFHTMSEEIPLKLREVINRLGLPVTSGFGDYLWLLQVMRFLKPGGRGAVLLPASGLRSKGIKGRLLRKLSTGGFIESITSLPGGLFALTGAPVVIVTVRSFSDPAPGPVLLQDLSHAVDVAGPRKTRLDMQKASRAARVILAFRHGDPIDASGYEARLVPIEDLVRLGLHPQIHLDPPPVAEARHPEPPVRGVDEVRLSGFKAFARETKIPLAPLTLLFGANSAGKSSILQSLQLIKQSVDSESLIASGRAIDAGSFSSVVNAQTNGKVRIGITFGAQRSWLAEATQDVIANPALRRQLDFEFERDSSGFGSRLREIKVGAGDSISQLTQTEHGDYFHSSRSNLMEVVQLVNSELYAYPAEALTSNPRALNHSDLGRHLGKVELDRIVFSGQGLLPKGTIYLDYALEKQWTHNRNYGVIRKLELLGRTLGGIREEFIRLLNSMVYLGPFRKAPQRFYSEQESSTSSDDSSQVVKKLGQDSVSLQAVNTWLKRLEIPYTLDVKRVTVDGDGSMDLGLLALTLDDHRSGATVTLADVGFGVSQILPIIAELNSRKESLICIEQPETHLHPRLQARLADLFMETVDSAGRQNQLIVETHSEHLLLRVQRAIREGSFNSSDLKVLYVDQSPEYGAFVQDIELNSRGEFVVPWPDGFFDDRNRDVFSGLTSSDSDADLREEED